MFFALTYSHSAQSPQLTLTKLFIYWQIKNKVYCHSFFGKIAAAASDSNYCYTHTLLHMSGLSVCHNRTPCLKRLTHSDANLQVDLQGLMTHCVRWGFITPREKEDLEV